MLDIRRHSIVFYKQANGILTWNISVLSDFNRCMRKVPIVSN